MTVSYLCNSVKGERFSGAAGIISVIRRNCHPEIQTITDKGEFRRKTENMKVWPWNVLRGCDSSDGKWFYFEGLPHNPTRVNDKHTTDSGWDKVLQKIKKENSEGIKKGKSRSISRSWQKSAGGFRGNMRLPTFTIFKITNPWTRAHQGMAEAFFSWQGKYLSWMGSISLKWYSNSL